MAFTDPIVSGTQLIRSAIQSENFIAGLSGWSTFKNGSAEFDALSLRGNLNVPDITLGGENLAASVRRRARGCVGYVRGYPSVSTTTEEAIMWLEVDFEAGRTYEMFLTNAMSDLGNAGLVQFNLRFSLGPVGWPNNAGALVATTLRLSPFEQGQIRALSNPTVSERYRFRVSISSLDGATVRSVGTGGGIFFGVYDMGESPVSIGSIGTVPPGKTLKEWTVSTSIAARYRGNGTLAPGATPLPSQTMSQGDFADGQGNYRSWAVFDAGALALIADVVGVPQSDILVAELFLDYQYWYNGLGGISTIGYHNKTSLGSVEPAGGVPNKVNATLPSIGSFWIDLLTSGFAPGSFMESLQNGYFRGIMIGNAGGTNKDYTGFVTHTAATRPALHLKYLK